MLVLVVAAAVRLWGIGFGLPGAQATGGGFTPVPPRSDRGYDQQDAFFLPLEGLTGIERPGPNFEVYRLRAIAR